MSGTLKSLLVGRGISAPLPEGAAREAARDLAGPTGWRPYARSLVGCRGVAFFLARRGREKRLCVAWDAKSPPERLGGFCGEHFAAEIGDVHLDCQAGHLDHANAVALRKHLDFLQPQVIGVAPTIGTGDRLGLATPAHVRAVRNSGLRPVFARSGSSRRGIGGASARTLTI